MKKKILSVDDSSSIRKMVEFTLKSTGYQVVSAQDGQEALDLMARELFDAVILDINMPRMDGFGVLKKIRTNFSGDVPPVIMLTTEGQDQDRKTALRLGATEYITKPFKPSELIALVNKVVKT